MSVCCLRCTERGWVCVLRMLMCPAQGQGQAEEAAARLGISSILRPALDLWATHLGRGSPYKSYLARKVPSTHQDPPVLSAQHRFLGRACRCDSGRQHVGVGHGELLIQLVPRGKWSREVSSHWLGSAAPALAPLSSLEPSTDDKTHPLDAPLSSAASTSGLGQGGGSCAVPARPS